MTTQELATTQPNPFEQYGNSVRGTTIEGDLLKFSKFGEWLAGKDAVKLDRGIRFIAHMESLQTGWIKWSDSKPVEVRMGLLSEGHVPARRADLDASDKKEWATDSDGKPRDPWQFTNSLVLVGPSAALYTFQPSSRGGISAIGELCRAYGRHMRAYPNELPVITLDMNSYRHRIKELGEIRVPILKVVDWVQEKEVAEFAANVNGKHDDDMDDEVPF